MSPVRDSAVDVWICWAYVNGFWHIGLGKTVTLIALLLKTFNKFPKAFSMTDEAVEKRYLAAAHDGWLEWDVIYRRQALTRLLSALRKHKQNDWFHYPVDVKHVPDYARIISSPIVSLYQSPLFQLINLCRESI